MIYEWAGLVLVVVSVSSSTSHPSLAFLTHKVNKLSPPSRRYFEHDHALSALRYISGTKLDERLIRADLDPGYLENRQYGRGKSGGQVRDEYRFVLPFPFLRSLVSLNLIPLDLAYHRDDFDSGRGGWGHLKTRQDIEQERQAEQDEIYRDDHDAGGRGREVPGGGGVGEDDEVSIYNLVMD